MVAFICLIELIGLVRLFFLFDFSGYVDWFILFWLDEFGWFKRVVCLVGWFLLVWLTDWLNILVHLI